MPIGVLGDRLRPRSQTAAEVSARVIARRPAILLIAVVLLALCLLASLFVGSSRIPAGQVAHYLLHPDASNVSYNIHVLRVQRTILGVLVGTALGVAGAVMQAVTRNPLAEPGLLGVNAGASLGIVLGTAVLGVLPVPGQFCADSSRTTHPAVECVEARGAYGRLRIGSLTAAWRCAGVHGADINPAPASQAGKDPWNSNGSHWACRRRAR